MKLIQTQEQKLQQVQRLSQQQMLQVHLLEMPLTELEQSVNAELDDNPALETTSPEDVFEGCHMEGNDSSASYGDDSQPSSPPIMTTLTLVKNARSAIRLSTMLWSASAVATTICLRLDIRVVRGLTLPIMRKWCMATRHRSTTN